jgi:hypothetical protein
MVRYNAFNVDPGKYQQQAMRNFTNAMQTGNQNQQAADRNALYRQQQADLRAQRRTQNAFETQRVGELQKRTEIDQQRADQQAAANKIRGFATVLSLSQYGKDADEKRKLFISGAKEVGLDDIAEDSPFVPSFNDDGSVSIPVGEGPDGNPLGVFDLKGERENIGKLLEAIKADPAIMQNEVAFASIANDLGVKYEVREGWSAQVKKEKTEIPPFQKERLKGYAQTLAKIDEAIASGTTKNEMGEEVPLTEQDGKRLMFLRKFYQNEANVMQGGKSVNLYNTPFDVQTAFQAGLISRENARSMLKKMGLGDRPAENGSAEGSKYGDREDGTKKGSGFFGALKMTDGSNRVATEISIGVEIGGKETEIPTLVPTLTKKQVDHLLSGGRPTKEIVDKAVKHARKRIASGKSPFASDVESQKATSAEKTNTEEQKKFFESDQSKMPGWKALIKQKTEEERKAAIKKRRERTKKSFARTPPTQ